MRTEKEIKEQLNKSLRETLDNEFIIELLLDIRELLKSSQNSQIKNEVKEE